jgi:beta-N-acetylhexosaminidase
MKNIPTILKSATILGLALAVLSCMPPRTMRPRMDLFLDADGARWVDAMMSRLTPEEKVAQMIGCRYAGEFFPADGEQAAYLKRLVAHHKVGGMVIFGGEAYETALLNNGLQSMADVPLLMASDFERGVGTQITGSTLFPTIMGLGAADSEDLAYQMGRYTALEGRALGIHMTYAPVVDVNINPDNPIINTRSIGENPEQIARLAAAFIKGCQDNGMLATAKHFPGHGDTDLDSHILLPVIKADRERLEKVELYPYRRAIAAGVSAVMVSHLVVPALDPTPNLPATLSSAILTALLRGQMGFKGLIVTDAMEMGGVTNSYTPTEAALKAIQAGCDMVLLPLETEKVVDFLKEQVRTGVLSKERVDASARRILEAKARVGLHRNRFVDVAALPLELGRKDALAQAQKTFEAAATLVKNEGGLLPLKPGTKVAVFSLSSDRGEYFAGRTFAGAVKSRFAEADVFYADADTGQEYLDESFTKAADADVYLCAFFSSLSAWKGSVGLDAKHTALIKKLKETGKPVVAVSFGSPYFLREFPFVDAYLCLYRNQPQTQSAAVKAIYGEIDVTGKLPVTIPGTADAGTGVILKKR